MKSSKRVTTDINSGSAGSLEILDSPGTNDQRDLSDYQIHVMKYSYLNSAFSDCSKGVSMIL